MMDRLAAAPISWGVCEVPGWGWQMDSGTVLAQMREVGVRATEFGPDGFLPADPQAKAAVLHDAGLQAVGGFVPVILHDPAHDPMPGVDAAPAPWCSPPPPVARGTTAGRRSTRPAGPSCCAPST
jgi:inosose dehydratase